MILIFIFFLVLFNNFLLFSNSLSNHAFITCQESNNLFVVDLEKQQVIKSYELGLSPAGIEIDKNHKKVLIANPDSNNISVIDTVNGLNFKIEANKSPLGITIDSKKSIIYVSNWYDNMLTVIDLEKKKILSTIKVGKSPAGLDFHPELNLIAVANRDSNSITLINGSNYNEYQVIDTQKSPFGVFFEPEGNLLAVTNVQSSSVSFIDLEKKKIIKNVKVGEWPYQVSFNKKFEKIYVTNQRDDSVSIIDYESLVHEKKIDDVCGYPEGINPSNNFNSIIISCWFDNEIVILDLKSLKKKKISVCEGPRSFGNFIF